MKILVDADFVVYKCTAAAESEIDFGNDVILVTSLFSDAYSCVKREIERIKKELRPHTLSLIHISEPTRPY